MEMKNLKRAKIGYGSNSKSGRNRKMAISQEKFESKKASTWYPDRKVGTSQKKSNSSSRQIEEVSMIKVKYTFVAGKHEGKKIVAGPLTAFFEMGRIPNNRRLMGMMKDKNPHAYEHGLEIVGVEQIVGNACPSVTRKIYQ